MKANDEEFKKAGDAKKEDKKDDKKEEKKDDKKDDKKDEKKDDKKEEKKAEEKKDEKKEDKKEEKKEEKKKSAPANPMLVASDLTAAQGPDFKYAAIASFGVSQSSLAGNESWSANAMIWSTLKQFSLKEK